jgi:pimeloyl-ACP methyl ester carboxylesterase
MLHTQLSYASPLARCELRPRRRAAAVVRCSAASAPPPAVRSSTHAVSGGVKLEVLHCAADAAVASRPALCFLHGSSHASWCWAEHFLPHFAARGYDAYALSMRGHVRVATRDAPVVNEACKPGADAHARALRSQGGSDAPTGGGTIAGTLASHAADLASFAGSLGRPVVLVGHSFGGLVVQECVSSRASTRPPLAGVALLCSVPPAGNSPMVRNARFAHALMLCLHATRRG